MQTKTRSEPLTKQAAMGKARLRLGNKVAVEEVVNLAGRLMLEETGVQAGSRIRVIRGKYAGKEYTVDCVAWSEAEVKVMAPGWADGRWFGLWFRPEFVVL